MTTVLELKKKVLKLKCTLKVSRAQLRKLHKVLCLPLAIFRE
jgi:hypothetical protein